MSIKITAIHERVDDIPTLIAHLKKMRVAEFLDKHFPTNGNWQGVSLGWTTVVWLAFILSEGDHRLARAEPWVTAHRRTLSRCIGRKVKPRDLTDDRLATVLDYLCIAACWVAFERELNQSVLRVYDLQERAVRVDTTTAAAYVTPDGMCQLGYSKDHRPDLPQVKIAMSVLDPLVSGAREASAIRLPHADGTLDETADPVAIGFAYTVELSALDQAGQTRTWQERRLVVRSLAFATSQEKSLRQRVARAVTEINALDERKQGKQRVPDEATASQAAAALMAQHRVDGLVNVTVMTEVHEHANRRYGTRPAITVRSERVRVGAAGADAPLAHAVRRLGWRVYATNHPAEEVSLAQGVAAYRSEYLIEQGFGRLKGRSLSLTPLFLHDEQRVVALICLWSIALRVLVLMQFVVRRNLRQGRATLKGIYPGQPGRQTAQPTTEMMLWALRGVTLSRIKSDGKLMDHLTPLNAVQKRILSLMEVPLESYDGLVT